MPYAHWPQVFCALLFSLISIACAASEAESATEIGLASENESAARALIKEFVGTLKPLLSTTIAEKGPVEAIGICAEQSPAIAANLSARSGWDVTRVSLKPRNAGALPDAWESQQLQRLAGRAAAGDAGPTLNVGERVDGRYRYLQAQPVEGMCLLCHGQNIDPAVAAAIQHYYPSDSATGYRLGDVRGAISLRAPVAPSDTADSGSAGEL